MYVPLRVHGHHSLLTGVDPPRALLQRAAALSMPALALADVNGMAGLTEFLQAAAEQPAEQPSVRPIVGAEVDDAGERPGRLIALVESEDGYRNLCKLVSARQLGYDPGEALPEDPDARAEEEARRARGAGAFDLVQAATQWREGLLLLVDHPRLLLGLHGRVPPRQLLAALSPASLRLGAVRDPRAVGKSRNTHVAGAPARTVRAHDAEDSPLDDPKVPPPARPVPAQTLLEAARAVGAAVVAVPDVYHAAQNGSVDHRVRVAIKHNALLEGLPEEWVASAPAHLLPHAELCALTAGLADVAGAWPVPDDARVDASEPPMVARTRAVAAACRYTPPLGGVVFPSIEVDEGESPYSRLCELAFHGAQRRFRPLRPEVLRRLDYELSTIQELGFAPYFLLVDQIARFARDAGIPCVGRGSAADSLVAYCLRLTDADPFRYSLPFERFLNPSRRDRPDVDLDFCWRRRDEVLDHVYELFGHDRTAMICTLNRFGLRSAFREAALAHGIPPAEINPWSGRLPMFLAKPEEFAPDEVRQAEDEPVAAPPLPPGLERNPLARTLSTLPEARGFPFDDERFVRTLQSAARLLDAPRHFGLHPGGVVVSPGPITDHVSCHRAAKGPVVTQLDKDGVEAIGLVKMDLLGNRALTTVDDCLGLLARRGVEVDLESLPEDDPETGQMLREGRTLGCFQIESPGMRHLLIQTGADTMDDVIQAVALIRPGPAGSGMKDAYVRRARGLEEPTPPHPRLVDVLWDTRGVMLYQEDVMQCAARVAGMDLAEADQLRRALQKRKHEELGALRERFLDGCATEGLERGEAEPVWDLAANFASFAFCKAHAVTYGRIAYRAAYLKAHHPAEFLTAFLLSETGYYPQRVYIEEARRLGARILPPDINRSGPHFAVTRLSGGEPALRVGLGQAKGLTERMLERLFAEREHCPFLSLPDFLERTGARRDEVETLIRCGAFDAFDRTRPELLWRLHLLLTPQQRAPKGAGLDAAQLAACNDAPPATRSEEGTVDPIEAARDRTGGWSGRGLGLTAAELTRGKEATLFPAPDTPAVVLPGLPDTSPAERGRLEFELLGLTLAAHPVALFSCEGEERLRASGGERPAPASGKRHTRKDAQQAVNPIPCGRLAAHVGARVTLRGWPAATRRTRTERGELMRFLTLEDESGLAEALLFPDVYSRDGHHLRFDQVLLVTGVVEEHFGAAALRVERVW